MAIFWSLRLFVLFCFRYWGPAFSLDHILTPRLYAYECPPLYRRSFTTRDYLVLYRPGSIPIPILLYPPGWGTRYHFWMLCTCAYHVVTRIGAEIGPGRYNGYPLNYIVALTLKLYRAIPALLLTSYI